MSKSSSSRLTATTPPQPQPQSQMKHTDPTPTPVIVASDAPDSGIQTQTISFVEPEPLPEETWRERHERARREMEGLLTKCRQRHFQMPWEMINENSWRIFIQALIQEGRLTEAEMNARVCEAQLIYLRAEYANAAAALTQFEAQHGPAANAYLTGMRGVVDRGQQTRQRGGLARAPKNTKKG